MITLEQIRTLAPDEGTFERSRKLLSMRRWRELGGNSRMIWGSCRSSGTRRHQVAALLTSDPVFKCSCPIARKPCKHILALLQLLHTHSDAFRVTGDPPPWANDLIRSLQEPSSPEEEAAANQRRTTQRSRQRDQRLERMLAGSRDLERWLLDLIRQGLAQTQVQPPQFWEDMAARLVDAQLGGLARRLRALQLLAGEADWPEKMLGELGELYLLTRSFDRLEELPPPLQREILNVAGLSVRKEELETQKSVSDDWLVAGKQQGAEENLRFQRTYLLGAKSRRTALVLEFVWGNNAFEISWPVGAAFNADLVFYPGSYPLRAQVRQYQSRPGPINLPGGFTNFEAFTQAYAKALAANPWLHAFPAALDRALPVIDGGNLLLIDSNRRQLPAGSLSPQAWKVIAISQGRPLWLFGEWNGRYFNPLSTIEEERIIPL